MKKLSDRERMAVFAATAILIVFALDRWALAPLWNAAHKINSEIARKRQLIAEERYALQERKQIVQDYRRLSHSLHKKDAAQGMNALLGEIETIARQSGVKIIDLKPEYKITPGGFAAAIAVEAAWEALAHFAYQIHQSPQLLQIERASLHRKSDDSDLLQGQWTIAELPRAD